MRISLFITCMVDTFYPQVGVSMVRLLRRLGCDVDFPQGQTCCGQPAFNSGFSQEARAAGATLLQSFQEADVVVAPSGSCAAMVKAYYPKLFAGTPWESEANALAGKTYELSQFIVDVLGLVDLGGVYPARATYHSSCHMMRGLGVKEQPLRLLSQISGLELVDLTLSDECCGFGGTFAVKLSDLSTAMADDKIEHVKETGAEILVGSDMACLMHLGGRLERLGAPVSVMHLAELLDRATMDRHESVKEASSP